MKIVTIVHLYLYLTNKSELDSLVYLLSIFYMKNS